MPSPTDEQVREALDTVLVAFATSLTPITGKALNVLCVYIEADVVRVPRSVLERDATMHLMTDKELAAKYLREFGGGAA